MERGISLCGLVVMIGLAGLMSSNWRAVRKRVVCGGLTLQFGLAWLLLPASASVSGGKQLPAIGRFFDWLLGHVNAGASFVFGAKFEEHFFAFKVLPAIIFFSALMSGLYHLGVMQRVVSVLGWLMQRTLGTSGAESLSAAANIFVGQTEAPLVVRPYLERMTESELMAVMVGGFATVAGGVMAAFIAMGIDAGHLVTASVISAPASLLIAKVLQPEMGVPVTLGAAPVELERTTVNLLDALAAGTTDGLKLALNVGAMMIAFLALIALVDSSIAIVGATLGQTWSLAAFLGYAFAPFAWLMGVESADVLKVGELVGLRMAANEFIAFERLAQWMQPDSTVHLSPRSQVIATYALCGFANFGSIGVQIGGLSALAPTRRADLARLSFRAMLGGTLACFMTACIAGVLIGD